MTQCPHPFFIFKEKMKFLLPILLLSAQYAFAQPAPDWFVYPGSPVASRFDDIFFVNDSTGWAVNSDGDIFKTMDAAAHWELQHHSADYFRSVEFFDDQLGFAGSLYEKLFKTMNGGEDWYEITDSLPGSFQGICGMSVADDSTIYICGVWSSPSYIFKSSDRGHSWERIDMGDYAYSLVDMKFTDKNHGFATGQSANLSEGGIILYTEDGGETWSVKKLTGHPNDYVWKIQLLNDTIAFGAIADVAGGFATRFLKSTDGGMNWDVKTVSTDYYYVEMGGFINADTGWTGSYEILETFDGGETWHENSFGFNVDRFFKVNDNLAFASGETIYTYSDTNYVAPIDTTEDTIISNLNSHFNPQHSISEIIPNPSSDFISIQYQIDRFTTIDLSVFDMQGNCRKNFYHGKINAGAYSATWHHNLEPGEYMVCMHSNEGLRWKKFVVQ